jgi:WD40 repeat protein
LFRLVRALELAAPDHTETQRSIRRALAATIINFPETARHLDPDDKFVSVAFSPDGHLFVTAKQDGHARIWESESGKLRKDIPMFSDGLCDGIAFSPDGTAFIATNGLEVRSWSLSGDRPLGPPIPSLIGKAKVVQPNVPPTKS